jgi:hypothetical protein
MEKIRFLLKSIIILNYCIAILFVFPLNVYAYIDPNTGGFFFTSVLPFVYGILAAIVIFWKRIVNTIKRVFFRNREGKS